MKQLIECHHAGRSHGGGDDGDDGDDGVCDDLQCARQNPRCGGGGDVVDDGDDGGDGDGLFLSRQHPPCLPCCRHPTIRKKHTNQRLSSQRSLDFEAPFLNRQSYKQTWNKIRGPLALARTFARSLESYPDAGVFFSCFRFHK